MLNLIRFFWIWAIFYANRSKLPTTSDNVNPKMEYEVWSGDFIWEDEGLWELPHKLAQAFRPVLHYRTYLVIGPENNFGIHDSKMFNKYVFKLAKFYFPNWIGFEKSRCSYSPELSNRMVRIIKVSNWRMEKSMNENPTQ